MPKGLNLSPFRPLDPGANLQEMQKEKKQVELLCEYAVKKKNQILGNSIAPTGWDKLYKLSNRHDKTIIFKNAHLGDKSIQM